MQRVTLRKKGLLLMLYFHKKHIKLTTWSLRDSLKTIPSASEVYNTPFPVSEMRQE